MKKWHKGTYRIGLEIYEYQLRFIVLMQQLDHWLWLDAFTEDFSPEQTPSEIHHAFRQARQKISKKIQSLIIGIPYSQSIIKEIKIDAGFNAMEIYQYLYQQTLHLAGANQKSWYLDFETVHHPECKNIRSSSRGLSAACPRMGRSRNLRGALDTANKSRDDEVLNLVPLEQYSIIFAAVAQPTVNRWLNLARQTNFTVQAVDIDVLGLLRILPMFEGYQSETILAAAWIKKSELIFLVSQQKQLLHIRRMACVISAASSLMLHLQQSAQLFHSITGGALGRIYLLGEVPEQFPEELSCTSQQNIPLQCAKLNNLFWRYSDQVKSLKSISQWFCCLGLGMW